jgi:predicted nucleic acid-binding protein
VIVFDTNVVSELMKSLPNERVLEWITALPRDEPVVTAVTFGEVTDGLAKTPTGRRRSELQAAWLSLCATLFEDRVLPFDRSAAEVLGDVTAPMRAIGRVLKLADAQIAAIALSQGARLATRDRDFRRVGLPVIDPWKVQRRWSGS